MTPTISPVTGALPQQPAPVDPSCATPPPPLQASPLTTTSPANAVGGGTLQAAQGAANVSPEQLIPAIQSIIASVTDLIAKLQGGAVTAGGAPGPAPGQVAQQPGQVGQCGMPGCTMNHAAEGVTQLGANAAPTAPSAEQHANSAPAATQAPAASPGAGLVDPSSVKDKSGTGGLSAAAKRGLEEAHRYGLPLVSGKREGNGTSDHDSGNATDVGTLPIGVAASDGATPTMKAFAEHMRQQGKAGQLNVKYVISDGRIASATNNWEWREYTYPDKTRAQLEALKSSNRGEYNRLQHFDHVHVSYR
ncbi:MAG: hypothetical protein JWL76_891 [Thermoleophilia bacterium]|nr:hypothetical protein [Thermoleophilia bacterium]